MSWEEENNVIVAWSLRRLVRSSRADRESESDRVGVKRPGIAPISQGLPVSITPWRNARRRNIRRSNYLELDDIADPQEQSIVRDW